MEVVSCLGDRAVIAIRSGRTRLVGGFHRDWAVEDTVGVTIVGLRLYGQTDALPAFEEVVCVGYLKLEPHSVQFRACGSASRIDSSS
jgi:hypothetical protein